MGIDIEPQTKSNQPANSQGAIVFDHSLHWNCVWEVLIDVDAAKLPVRSAHPALKVVRVFVVSMTYIRFEPT